MILKVFEDSLVTNAGEIFTLEKSSNVSPLQELSRDAELYENILQTAEILIDSCNLFSIPIEEVMKEATARSQENNELTSFIPTVIEPDNENADYSNESYCKSFIRRLQESQGSHSDED
jgi:hypothetical protein